MNSWIEKAEKFIERCNRGKPRSRSRSRSYSRSRSRSYSRSRSRSSSCSLCQSRSGRSRSHTSCSSNISRNSRTSGSPRNRPIRSTSIVSRSVSKHGRSSSPQEISPEKDRYVTTAGGGPGDTDLLDLSKDLQPLSSVVNDRHQLLQEAVDCIDSHHLASMIPLELKEMSLNELEDECLELLGNLDTEAVLKILNGKITDQDSVKEVQDDNAESRFQRDRKKKKSKRKHKKSKHKHKKKCKDAEEQWLESSDKGEMKPDLSDTDQEMCEKSRIINNNSVLQRSLMELLEIGCRAKALKSVLLREGLDASKLDQALDTTKNKHESAQATSTLKKFSCGNTKSNSDDNLEEISSAWVKSSILCSLESKVSEHLLPTVFIKPKAAVGSKMSIPELCDDKNQTDGIRTVQVITKPTDQSSGHSGDHRSRMTLPEDTQSVVKDDDDVLSLHADDDIDNVLYSMDEGSLLADAKNDSFGEVGGSDSEDESRRNWRHERVDPKKVALASEAITVYAEEDSKTDDMAIIDQEKDDIAVEISNGQCTLMEYISCNTSPINSPELTSNASESALEENDLLSVGNGSNEKSESESKDENQIGDDLDLKPKDRIASENPPESIQNKHVKESTGVDPSQTSWYERWFQSHKTQKVLKTNRLQTKLKSKLKAEKVKTKEAVAESSPVTPSEPDAPIIGTIEEYKKLFGKNLLQKPGASGIEVTDLNTAAGKNNSKMDSPKEESDNDDEGLWEDILGCDDDETI